jgi:hypothetical protein
MADPFGVVGVISLTIQITQVVGLSRPNSSLVTLK